MENKVILRGWGLSMYGGYYANTSRTDSREWEGKHFAKYSQLKDWAKENGFKLSKEIREDNI